MSNGELGSGGDGFSGAGLGFGCFEIGCPANHREIGRDAQMACAPLTHFGHHRNQIVAGFGEAVGDLRWSRLLDSPLDDAIILKLA